MNQQKTLKEMSQVENQTLQQFVKAFKSTKSNTTSKEESKDFASCEKYRSDLLNNDTQITYEIFASDRTSTVQQICKKAASTKKWCQLLYRLVKSTDNPRILEIGTNVGVSGIYMLTGLGKREGKLTTMEGLPQLCELSSNQFASIVDPSKFEVVQGLYDDTFQKVLDLNEEYNLIFIDGNHKKDPTLEYYNKLKTRIGDKAIFILDDIYWSEGMKEAWDIIKKDPDANFSIDMYEQGIIIIDKIEAQKNRAFSLHLSY